MLGWWCILAVAFVSARRKSMHAAKMHPLRRERTVRSGSVHTHCFEALELSHLHSPGAKCQGGTGPFSGFAEACQSRSATLMHRLIDHQAKPRLLDRSRTCTDARRLASTSDLLHSSASSTPHSDKRTAHRTVGPARRRGQCRHYYQPHHLDEEAPGNRSTHDIPRSMIDQQTLHLKLQPGKNRF
jgi:hypothetical protein